MGWVVSMRPSSGQEDCGDQWIRLYKLGGVQRLHFITKVSVEKTVVDALVIISNHGGGRGGGRI